MIKRLCVKLLLVVVVFFVLGLFTSSTVFAEQINRFDATIQINPNGTIDVSEKILYDFGTLNKHGIFRTIPYAKTNQDGKKYRMSLGRISVTDESGKSYHFTTTDENDALELKIGDANRTITGVHTYIISYSVSGAITYFSDHDELNWNVTGNEWDVAISRATATVVLPSKLTQAHVQLACYSGSYGSKTTCTGQTDGEKSTFTSPASFLSNEGMTVVVGFPKNIVAVLEPTEVIPFFDTLAGKLVAGLLIILGVLWYLVYPIWLIIKWYKVGRDPKEFGAVSAWFDPPKDDKGRSLTPAETGTLYDEKADMADVVATIVDLARRGYVRIEERKKKRLLLGDTGSFYLVKTGKTVIDSTLLFESDLLEDIFGSSDEVELKQNTDLYNAVTDCKEALHKQVVTAGLFPKNPQSVRNFYAGMTVASVFTANILLFFSSLIFGRAMSRRTLFGAEQLGIAKSLRNFLVSQERQLTFQADKQMMFEKLLPYAVVFGVEKIWAKRFKDINLTQPDWYSSYRSDTFNAIIFTNALSSSITSFATAATPTRSSSGFSSGLGGGGFSGGGGGGGGGGSW